VGKANASRECAPDGVSANNREMVGTAQERLCPPCGFTGAVIASEAKQSMAPQAKLDCFVAKGSSQ
jgi:hypothetical protein